MKAIQNITLLGSGNVATQLGKALQKKGITILQVFSRNPENATQLAHQIGAMAISNLQDLDPGADLYLICIKDDSIGELAGQFPFKDRLIAHTSGSIPMDVLSNNEHYGIFYPLQTFTKDQSVDFLSIPFCIEANSPENEEKLMHLAGLLSEHVTKISSEQRKAIHLAAVFACNFSNNMYAIAEDILTQNGMSLDLLKPLIRETADKISTASPQAVQTGPAKRGDLEIMKNHLQMLADSKEYQDIYRIISDNILKQN
ncbi:MAG: DUF2520 domain-containing protein [Flavobacteriales bacterium]|nr:DUF2520 domain-containing protein [Flavobacteriales bacterium]